MRRRTFLRTSVAAGLVAGLAGCASDTSDDSTTAPRTTAEGSATTTDAEQTTEQPEETTEDEPDIDRSANYRWDMQPGRNEQLRSDLGQYVEEPIGKVVEEHPAFAYSTDSERDDHEIDFEALKLYRDSNYDILAQDATEPMEPLVEAFVTDEMYEEAKTSRFLRNDADAPSTYSSEAWRTADTVEESLDLGHNLILSIDALEGQYDGDRTREQAAIIREAYKRHHPEFDVLAWSTQMGSGHGYDTKISGLMYSPDDDKVRAFEPSSNPQASTSESRQIHTEIQNWNVINDPENESRGDADELFHPLLFHTDEWNRQNPGFEYAKEELVSTVFDVATDSHISFDQGGGELLDSITTTTGTAKQLSRTLAEYNTNDADFEDVWNLSATAVGKYIADPSIDAVIDTVNPEGGDYDEYFSGGFGFYEVEDQSVVDAVRADRNGEYDNFGQVYDELDQL